MDESAEILLNLAREVDHFWIYYEKLPLKFQFKLFDEISGLVLYLGRFITGWGQGFYVQQA